MQPAAPPHQPKVAPPNRRGVVVLGAGPAGLATAAELSRRGIDALVVDRAEAVGASWRGHYDRLHLHTVRWLSGLPGLPMPKRYGPWVSREHVVEYLEDYARHHRLDLRLGTQVRGLRRDGADWIVETGDGDEVRAGAVVVATGYNHTPLLPDWPGRHDFTGELLHASQYKNGEPYAGQEVLVVGAGNSGGEIAVDLVEHGARRVLLAVRTPPHLLLREVGGIPTTVVSVLTRYVPSSLIDPVVGLVQRLTVGDLTQHGLPRPDKGVYQRAREEGQIPILDVGLVDAMRAGTVEVVASVEAFDGPEVLLSDGTRLQPDVIVAATGYRRGLGDLVGHLGVLTPDGTPTVHGARTAPTSPGLHFIGYTNPISGMFRELRLDARRIARAIERRAPVGV
jgi:putative flavoprotein involved in K+ transport